MFETKSVNHLVTSFYMKIVCQLLSKNTEQVRCYILVLFRLKQPSQMIDVLDRGRFVESCCEHMQFGAVAELVVRLVSIPYNFELGMKIREVSFIYN